ncbi:MAG: T9SS type A sorting domain-containing protein, partial [Endomicrobia bacterium]|nr:T9SS type A sorting domain-containing protein [Endomicrobiia bacterium]
LSGSTARLTNGGSTINASAVTYNSSNRLTASFTIPNTATIGNWNLIVSSTGYVSDITKTGIFAIIEAGIVANTVENVKYYPNPMQPSKGMNYAKMHFSNLPAGTIIKIYTLLGQGVKNLEADASGMAVWDGNNENGEKASSGMYMVYMEDSKGNKKRIKIAMER